MPLFFVYVLSLEEKHGTNYQIYCLPTGRHTTILYKFWAAVSYSALWAPLSVFYYNMHINVPKFVVHEPSITLFRAPKYPGYFYRFYLGYLSDTIGFLSIIVFAVGVSYVMSRFRQITGLITFFVAWIVVHLLYDLFFLKINLFLLHNPIISRNFVVSDLPLIMSYLLYFLIIYSGLILYHKFSEI